MTKIEFGSLDKDFTKNLGKHKYAIIADSRVAELFGRSLHKDLQDAGFDVHFATFRAGEENKTRETKLHLENFLLSRNFGKDSCIIALGGGVTLDMAGFVAATYCRGVDLIFIPTTLLAMVDACLGGKVAVNTAFGKNLIGTYYPASLVFIDKKFLKSLPKKELLCGFAEIIKHALIASPNLFSMLENPDLEEVIKLNLKIKQKIVKQDFYETGKRKALNFGHTLGHALEAKSGFTLSHGEAVAKGTAFASLLSFKMGFLKEDRFFKILRMLKKFGFCLKLDDSFEDLYDLLQRDKKADNGQVRFVLLKDIGKVCKFGGTFCTNVDLALLRECYEYFAR